jgi:hypothetical protein
MSLALGSLAGCWDDSEAPHGDAQQVEELFDDYYASLDRQCDSLRACYPALQTDERRCWGPIPGPGPGGRAGWPETSAEARAEKTACLEKIYARSLASLTMLYNECVSRVFVQRESCLRGCPADVSVCFDGQTSEEQCDQDIMLTPDGPVSRLCGL